MRQNIVFLSLKKDNGELMVKSVSIVDMLSRETRYHAHNINWDTFYKKCCEWSAGTIVCNCLPRRLRSVFAKNNINFSERKYIVDFYGFIGLKEMSGRPVKPLMMLMGIRSNRNFDKLYHTMDVSENMSDFSKIWADNKLVGIDILQWLVDDIGSVISQLSVIGKEYIIDYIEQLTEVYDLKVNVAALRKIKVNKVDKRVLYLWFDSYEEATIGRAVVSTSWASDIILHEVNNPTIEDLRNISIMHHIGEVITNIDKERYNRFLQDNDFCINADKVSPWICYREVSLKYKGIGVFDEKIFLPSITITGSIYYKLLSIEDIINIRLRNKDAFEKYADIVTYAYIIYTLLHMSLNPRYYANCIARFFHGFNTDVYTDTLLNSEEVFNNLRIAGDQSMESYVEYLKLLAMKLIDKYKIES